MLDMGVPETMPSYASVDIKPVFQEAYQNGGCKITCNGKPAWFKGQFPCFGKLAVLTTSAICPCCWCPDAINTLSHFCNVCCVCR